MTLTPETSFRGFRDEYGGVDYSGALVLDIGADYGCTAELFLERGAKRVIACEKNPEWRARLAEWAEGKPVTVVGEVGPENLSNLFAERPDVVKVDCEGCERMLLGLPDGTLGGPRSWVMETHSEELYVGFVTLFERLGYEVRVVKAWPENPPDKHRVVIQADR